MKKYILIYWGVCERIIEILVNVEWDDINGIFNSNIIFVFSIKKDKCKYVV